MELVVLQICRHADHLRTKVEMVKCLETESFVEDYVSTDNFKLHILLGITTYREIMELIQGFACMGSVILGRLHECRMNGLKTGLQHHDKLYDR